MSALTMSGERPQQIADGIKTLTFRPVTAGDTFRAGDGNTLPDAVVSWKRTTKWRVGGTVPIKSGRIQPTCLVEDRDCEVVRDLRRTYLRLHPRADLDDVTLKEIRDYLLHMHDGFSLLYVKVLSLRRVDVRDTTDEDAIGAGFSDAYVYLKWWTQTYDRRAWRAEQDFYALHYGTFEHVEDWRDWLKEARPQSKYDAWRIQFERHVP